MSAPMREAFDWMPANHFDAPALTTWADALTVAETRVLYSNSVPVLYLQRNADAGATLHLDVRRDPFGAVRYVSYFECGNTLSTWWTSTSEDTWRKVMPLLKKAWEAALAVRKVD